MTVSSEFVRRRMEQRSRLSDEERAKVVGEKYRVTIAILDYLRERRGKWVDASAVRDAVIPDGNYEARRRRVRRILLILKHAGVIDLEFGTRGIDSPMKARAK